MCAPLSQKTTGSPYCSLNRIRCFRQLVVFPDHDELPASGGQRLLIAPITLDVPVQLWQPVVEVRLRQYSVDGTAVPEASAAFDRDASLGKDDVGTTPQPSDDGNVLSKAKATSMQLSPQRHFRLGVRRAVASHNCAGVNGGGDWNAERSWAHIAAGIVGYHR